MREPKCDHCRHFIGNATADICKAFPDGIPDEAIFAEYDIECAPGIKFEEIDD